MKKVLSLILSIVLAIIATGCTATEEKTVVLPPNRIGENTLQVTLEKRYTLETAFSEADVVARIQVGNWIAEDADLYKSHFEATVLECFKGSISDTFTLLQDGCSAATMKGYPLFTAGNEILVFLKEAALAEYESSYWIMGSFTTVLDVSYDDSGARYYVDRYGIFGEFANITRNYALEHEISNEVIARVIESDPIISEMQYAYPFIWAEEDIVALFDVQ